MARDIRDTGERMAMLPADVPRDAIIVTRNLQREYVMGTERVRGVVVKTGFHDEAGTSPFVVVREVGGIEPYARVGAHTRVWSNVTLAHHSSVEDHCWVAAGTVISGQARVLRNTFLGVGCTVVNSVTVGEFNVVGAGALISRDTKPHSVHLARSAEPFRYSSEDYVKHFGI